MRCKTLALLTMTAGLVFGAAASAEPAAPTNGKNAAPLTEMSAQYRRPPRVIVHPLYRQRLLYRQCTDWYVIEARVTGPTVVPRSRCWWVRG